MTKNKYNLDLEYILDYYSIKYEVNQEPYDNWHYYHTFNLGNYAYDFTSSEYEKDEDWDLLSAIGWLVSGGSPLFE